MKKIKVSIHGSRKQYVYRTSKDIKVGDTIHVPTDRNGLAGARAKVTAVDVKSNRKNILKIPDEMISGKKGSLKK